VLEDDGMAMVVRDEVEIYVKLRGQVTEVSERHSDSATPGQRDDYQGRA
jgi:hypothetical protein